MANWKRNVSIGGLVLLLAASLVLYQNYFGARDKLAAKIGMTKNNDDYDDGHDGQDDGIIDAYNACIADNAEMAEMYLAMEDSLIQSNLDKDSLSAVIVALTKELEKCKADTVVVQKPAVKKTSPQKTTTAAKKKTTTTATKKKTTTAAAKSKIQTTKSKSTTTKKQTTTKSSKSSSSASQQTSMPTYDLYSRRMKIEAVYNATPTHCGMMGLLSETPDKRLIVNFSEKDKKYYGEMIDMFLEMRAGNLK